MFERQKIPTKSDKITDVRSQYSPVLHDVRVQYKMGGQAVVQTAGPVSPIVKSNGEVIQRVVQVAANVLDNAEYIYSKCEKTLLKIAHDYGLSFEPEFFIAAIEKMIGSTEKYSALEYRTFSEKICVYICEHMPPEPVDIQETDFPFNSIEQGALYDIEEVNNIDRGRVFEPLSPIVTHNDTYRPFRMDRTVDFQTKANDKIYHVGGPGRFLTGVGTYKDLFSGLPDNIIVNELNKSFNSREYQSPYEQINKLYALIVAVEGCARTAHNIAMADIFFWNYDVIKKDYPDKTLFELAETFLTFVRAGGTARAKAYQENPEGLKLLLAHCRANGINVQSEEEISGYLQQITASVLDNAKIQFPES